MKNKKAKEGPKTLLFCYGPMSSLLHLSKLSKMIPDEMRYVRKVSVGESHCLFQMGDCSLWGVGSNEHG